MNFPFTTEQFLNVFAQYNVAVWPMQIALISIASLIIILLLFPGKFSSRIISCALALLWAWTAIAYHFIFFSTINPAAWFFGIMFLAGAFCFAWYGVIRQGLEFNLINNVSGWIGALFIFYSLTLYPLIGQALGISYPEMPTFGLPCPTTIFTLGVLLFSVHMVQRIVFLIPLIWTAIGSFAAYKLGVYQDLGLMIAGLISLIIILRKNKSESQLANI